MSEITVHHVLAGAYRGRDIADRVQLTHGSRDRGDTSICRLTNLCDVQVDGPPTCARCLLAWNREVTK